MRRRACERTTKTNNTRKVAVGTVRKSQEATCATWLARKVRQVWEDGPRSLRNRARYLATVDWAISSPSFWSSPWIRGAPQSGLAGVHLLEFSVRHGRRYFRSNTHTLSCLDLGVISVSRATSTAPPFSNR